MEVSQALAEHRAWIDSLRSQYDALHASRQDADVPPAVETPTVLANWVSNHPGWGWGADEAPQFEVLEVCLDDEPTYRSIAGATGRGRHQGVRASTGRPGTRTRRTFGRAGRDRRRSGGPPRNPKPPTDR